MWPTLGSLPGDLTGSGIGSTGSADLQVPVWMQLKLEWGGGAEQQGGLLERSYAITIPLPLTGLATCSHAGAGPGVTGSYPGREEGAENS